MLDRSPDPAHRAARDALRAQLRAQRRALPPAERVERSGRLVAQLAAHPFVGAAELVAAYLAVGGEPDLRAWLETLPAVALPRTVGTVCAFHRWRGEPLEHGVFGIPEPPLALPLVDPRTVDVWLVPGLAFDRAGNRLGRGAGHYDRVLAGVPGRKIGVAWRFQLVDAIPAEPHDVPMDALVTEDGWVNVTRPPGAG